MRTHEYSQFSRVRLLAIPWTAARQASLSMTNSQSLLKPMSIESVMSSNHLILCHPLLLPSVFPSIRVFSIESVLHIRWPKYWSFSFSISPSNEYPGLPVNIVPPCFVCAKSLQSCLTLCDPMDYKTCQGPLSLGFSRQEYWSGLSCPPSGDLPDPGIKPTSISLLCWWAGSLPLVPLLFITHLLCVERVPPS